MCPAARGDLSNEEKAALRAKWYARLAKTPAQAQLFASYLSRPPPPLPDLRREHSPQNVFLPPKVRNRERAEKSSTNQGDEEDEEEEGKSRKDEKNARGE